MQNKIIKSIFGFDYYTPTQEVYDKTNILEINKLKILEQVKFTYNVKNNNLKSNTKLSQVSDCHKYSIRSKQHLRTGFYKTARSQNNPVQNTTIIYKTIPQEITNLKNIRKMCHNLQVFLRK
ncbi:hypothetical protein WA026_021782 [Henosepilachna vigintioctopunctata]|uniref:Uncharacterized protein n=1 Tax=Henosepilachna vigintioctopunctata TaxID=420089 RepID=A0AAW1TSI3_9CUCU